MFDLGGANSKCESTKGSVSARVAIAAHHGASGQRDAEGGSDNVHDALFFFAVPEERDAKLPTVAGEGGELLSGETRFVDFSAIGGDVVVYGRECEVGTTDRPVLLSKTIEGLGRSDLMDQMTVDVEEHPTVGKLGDNVRLPNLVEEGRAHDSYFDSEIFAAYRMQASHSSGLSKSMHDWGSASR
jgi:hypothetical protein